MVFLVVWIIIRMCVVFVVIDRVLTIGRQGRVGVGVKIWGGVRYSREGLEGSVME